MIRHALTLSSLALAAGLLAAAASAEDHLPECSENTSEQR